MSRAVDLAPMSRQLLDYWHARRRGPGLPARTDFDVICDLPRLAAYVMLIEVLEGPAFRFRVIGTALVDRARRNVTGRMLDREIYGDHIDEVLMPLAQVVEQRRPVRVRGLARGVKTAPAPMESFCVPLSESGADRVAYILTVVSFDRQGDEAEPEARTVEVLAQDVCQPPLARSSTPRSAVMSKPRPVAS
jgi:hypothetical protein